MKTKTGIVLLICLGFNLSLFSQYYIQTFIGNVPCVGELFEVALVDVGGNIVNDNLQWDVNGQNFFGNPIQFYLWNEGGHEISVIAPDGSVVTTFIDAFNCFIEIDGPYELCVGECGQYYAFGGTQPYIYDWFGQGPATIDPGFGSVIFCPEAPGDYGIIVTDNYGITATIGVTVSASAGIPEIFSLSGAFCLDDSLSSCDRVCENTTVTYATEVTSPGQTTIWSVSGAESWEQVGNEVIVEWGEAGQGQVSVSTSGGLVPDWYINCGQFKNGLINEANGTGYVYIDGTGFYDILLSNGQSASLSGPGAFYFDFLSSGTYTVYVIDEDGNEKTCSFTIEELEFACQAFGIGLDVTPSSDCNSCTGLITPVYLGNGTPPYAFEWIGPGGFVTTTESVVDACTGVYTLNLYTSNGCMITTSTELTCSTITACPGSNSICVDILEVPDAAFETTPAADNGTVTICEGQSVYFDNQTSGSFNYTWDFGDGISSSQVDAEHAYTAAGTYEAILIARNDCFCGDTASVTIIVEEAITPEIDCAGTICPGEEITYTSNADCSVFYWNVSTNGTIISGGGLSDDFITVDWGAGPIGIIELSVDGCSGDYCLQNLYETIPIIDDNAEIEGPTRVCKGVEVSYSMPPYAGTEFIWSVSSFGTITEGQGTNEVTIQWADQVTNQQQQVIVEYESCYLGCGGQDTLPVNILNEIFIEGPIEACPDETHTYTCRTPLGTSVNADWTVLDENGAIIATSSSALSDFEVNWNFGSGSFTVHADVQYPTNYCVDNFSVFVEVVAPTAMPNSISGILEVCPGTAYTYTANSSSNDFDYTWYITDGGTDYTLNGKTVNIIWNSNGPYNLALSQTNLEGLACESATISVGPDNINSVALSGDDEVCHEAIGVYTATSYSNLKYSWEILPATAGSILSGEETNEVEILWHTPGTHDVVVTVCGVSDQQSVTVHPKPNPVPVYSDVCPGQTTPVSVIGVYNAYEWRNEFGNTLSNAPTVNLGSGYYEVIVTDNNGCTKNETFYIGTYGQPEVTVSTPDFGNFCQNGGSMVLYALETSSGPLDYQWYRNGVAFGTNSSEQTITEEGNYYVQVTDINGCTAFSNTLGLSCGSLPPGDPMPGCIPIGYPDFDIIQGAYCNESQYINTSVNGLPGYSWEFIDIVGGGISYSFLENPSHTWTNAGFNLVTFTTNIQSTVPGQACQMSTFQFDTIPLAANFVYAGACAMQPISFTDISTFIPQTSINSWLWNFGDPASGANNTSMSQNPNHTYAVGGNYLVSLTVTDMSGCISVHQETVTVVDPPLASFVIPASSCEGASLYFEANGNYTKVFWDFGDPGSGDANTSELGQSYHVYSNPGTYTVTLTVENIYGCMESISQEVEVEPNSLTGIINVSPATTVCAGDSVILTAPSGDFYDWSTGSHSASITVLEAGTYEVTVYDALGCGYTPPQVIIDLIPLPQGEITAVEYNEHDQPTNYYYNSYETCYGEDVNLQITDNPNYTYEWPDGEVGTEVSYTDEKDNLLEVGTHIIVVEITDVTTGCVNTANFVVIVHPVPENIIINSNPAAPVCENTPTVFSVFNPDANYTYVWNTGEVGTSITTIYAGSYFVRAINEFGCEGESNILEIVPGPNVNLIPSGCHARCNPDTICLPPLTGVSFLQWYFEGNPIPAPEGNDPDYVATQSGEYYLEMVSADGCVTVSDVLTLDLYDGFGSVFGTVYFDINENGIIDAADTLMPGISIILQNGGMNVDTLVSNQIGSFAFANILSTDYEIVVDTLNLENGMTAVISEASANLVGCDDEASIEFLLEFICPVLSESLMLEACTGSTVMYNGTELNIGDNEEFTFLTAYNCDSTVTVMVNEIQESSLDTTLYVCTGSSVMFNGTDLSGGTTTSFILQNAVGCDSLITAYVEDLPVYDETESLSACTGTMVDYNGTELEAGSTTVFNYTSMDNCDSTVTVVVAELSGSTELLVLEACENGTVMYNGTELNPNSTTEFIYNNINGCDSTVTIYVQTLATSSSSLQLSACTGSTVFYNGTELTPGETMDFTFNNAVGCDSIVSVNVTENPVYNIPVNLEACEGETVEFAGMELSGGTVTEFMYTSVAGCDSVMNVIVETTFPSAYALDVTSCNGGTYNYNGQNLEAGTITEFIYENAVGCDSVVTVNVIESDQDSSSISLQACIGTSVDYNGTALEAGTSTDFTFTSSEGCDSIVTVLVNTLQTYAMTEHLSACTGAGIDYNGIILMAGTTSTFNFSSIHDCDSTVTVVVAELEESVESLQLEACENGTVMYNGTELFPSTTTDFVYTNALGCDSTLTVYVQPLSISTETMNLSACPGEVIDYDGTPLNPGDTQDFTYTNVLGCDSVVTVHVVELSSYDIDMELSACEGTMADYNGTALSIGSTTTFNYATVAGCDSMVTVYVAGLSASSHTLNVSACDGDDYPYNGENLPAGSTTDFVYTNAAGCDSTVSVHVAPVALSETFLDLSVCAGETVDYEGDELSAGFSGTYIFTDQNGCDSTVIVSVNAYPVFDFDVNTEVSCWNESNGSIYIENLTGGTAPFIFSADGLNYQDSTTFSEVPGGDFTILVQDANGCEESLEVEVGEISELEISVEVPQIPCDFSAVQLNIDNEAANPGIVNYLWNTGSTQSFINVDTPGVYTVIIESACEIKEESFDVSLMADGRKEYFYVPNLFSPNNDGLNDVWQIMPPEDMEVVSFELHVFDRWGNHLKTFESVYDYWDAGFNGKAMDNGVYVWWYDAVVISCGRQLRVQDKGDVTIVR